MADILTAAVRVLEREGAARFTCARVAEAAGVSIGSLYQYFPNKAALLFALQRDEWRETRALLYAIIDDRARPPLDRLRAVVHAFVRSECEEAAMRQALDDAAPYYRDAPEALEARADDDAAWQGFVAEARPDLDAAARVRTAQLVKLVLGGAGKAISEDCPDLAEADAHAAALAEMLCHHLALK
ncbi:TetR family transcriptional regulator [Sphingomonas sp.]|uniref:TetR family transcriptional regulator n=1 Tax=Sphingomonas sp. TaxID=28214 RepID=UPI0025F076E6|nr:TetR family transcriptional regulator [Sphingomonas sp.]